MAFGNTSVSRTRVQLWYNWFKEGREDVSYNTCTGRPSTRTTDENIKAVKKIILDNCQVTIREVAAADSISFGSCQAIFTDV